MSGISAGRSAMRMGPAELVQAAAMARRFYLEGKSKIQIAEEFGVSRFKVARVLETALERDLVRIEIRVPAELDAERSDALRARYGLRHAVVVESPAEEQDDAADPENLGEVAADLLGELVAEGDVLGLAWGRSTIHMAAALDRLPAVHGRAADRRVRRGHRRARLGRGGPPRRRRSPAARRTRSTRPMLLPDPATAAALRQPDGHRPRLRVLRQGDGRRGLHRLLGAGHLHRPRHALGRGARRTTPRSAWPPRCPRTSSTPTGAGSAGTSASGASPWRPTGCAGSPRSSPSPAGSARPRRSARCCARGWSPASSRTRPRPTTS